MPGSARALPLRHAVLLGMLHGPTELLPISSSAHTTLVPWLAGWPYDQLDPRLRKSFEVALHAGTAAALLLRAPSGSHAGGHGRDDGAAIAPAPPAMTAATTTDSADSARKRVGPRLGFLVAGLTPPALAGYALGERIERQLGTPAKIAYGLLAGSAAMAGIEVYKKRHAPRVRGGHRPFLGNDLPPHATTTGPHGQTAATGVPEQAPCTRPVASADARDGLALGLAQALALIPGVSRNGATLAAARARGFSRRDADQLSWTVGLPVIAGATLLQGTRLAHQQARTGTQPATVLPLAAGAASAFFSTLASSKVLDRQRRVRLLPACIAYRGVLAALVIRHMRDNTS
jgi:undecaprenyl-diphosphatase